VKSEIGFSLIELIVATAIMGVFFGLFGFNYNLSQEKNQLKSATRELRSLIDLTRQNTQSGLVPSGCTSIDASGNLDFQGYGLTFNAATEKVTQNYYCANSAVDISTYGFKKFPHIGIVSATYTSIYFLRGTSELLNPTGQKIDQTVTLINSRINRCSSITINKFGIITTDESVSCP